MAVDGRMAMDDRTEPLKPEPSINHLADHAHVLPHFQRAWRDAKGPAIRRGMGEPIDNAAAHAVPCELAGHGQTNWAGADDQNIRHGFPPETLSNDSGL